MKKNYFAPETKVVKIQLHKMIAASPEGFTQTLGGADAADKTDGTNILSRRRNSIWDDEEQFTLPLSLPHPQPLPFEGRGDWGVQIYGGLL